MAPNPTYNVNLAGLMQAFRTSLQNSKEELDMVRKQTISYNSEIDAIVAVTKRLCKFEEQYNQTSENFFHSYTSGRLADTSDFVDWSNTYKHFLAIRTNIERQIVDAA